MLVCVRVFCEKVESVVDGVGVKDSNYLASLARKLETYSERIAQVDNSRKTADITSQTDDDDDDDDDRGRQGVQMGAGNMPAVIRGVRALASARSLFINSPCTYDEVHVRTYL